MPALIETACTRNRPARHLSMSLLRLVASCLIVHALFAGSARGEPAPPAEPRIQVMILGAYHFGNPGRDLHNVKAEDVTTPRRQAELADVARRLEQFHPTRVAVEADSSADDLVYPAYRAFKPADLLKVRNETIQLGFRIAHDVGLADVHGIDADGDFPYDKVKAYAERVGGARAARLADANQRIEAMVKEFSAAQHTETIRTLLARYNDPALIRASQDFYYGVLALGDAKTQPGAELNAAWYLRNARIFTKLIQVAKPGDHVIVVFGAGHAYWLRHFVQTTPGFELVEPTTYLIGAKP
jgi:glutathione S-transferase